MFPPCAGHWSVLHCLSWSWSPWHSLTPWAGAGLSQSLRLVSVPPPQLREHSDQSAQDPHESSTGPASKDSEFRNVCNCNHLPGNILETRIEIMIQLTLVLIALPDLHRFPVAIFAIIGWWRRVALPEPHFCSYTTGPGTIGPAFPWSPGTIRRTY